MAETKYFFYRNDQHKVFFEFNPEDPTCLDNQGYKYFGRVLNNLYPSLIDLGYTIYVTAWTVHELPTYGSNVIVCILQDEWSREVHYRDKVGLVFRTCGKYPINLHVYHYGGLYDITVTFLAQGKAVLCDKGARIKMLMKRAIGKKMAPVHDIPLGYFPLEETDFIPFEERQNDLYFAGSIQHLSGQKLKRPKELARERMVNALEELQNINPDIFVNSTHTQSFSESIKTSNYSYLKNLMNTKICPIPRGANLETFRFYEAIRFGCIPVGECFPEAYFYNDAPIIRLNNWSELKTVVPKLLKDKDKLIKMHQDSLAWWNEKCSEVSTSKYMLKKLNDLMP